MLHFFFFKQKTAYEMRISDWSSDVCSSDLPHDAIALGRTGDIGVPVSNPVLRIDMRLVHQGADMIVPIPHHANEAKVATEDGTNGRQYEAEAMADLYLVPPAGEDRFTRCGVVTAGMAQARGPEADRVRDVAESPRSPPRRERRER